MAVPSVSTLERRTLIAAYVVAAVWWLCFIPGFFSGDSFGVLAEASSGRISGALTSIWPLYVRFLTAAGRFPGLATLADVILLTYALQTWCRAALGRECYASVLLVMTATPLVGAMGITLWHDIPMTAGLLLLSAVATSSSWFSRPMDRLAGANFFAGAALTAFRPNGLPTLVGFAVLAAAGGRARRRAALYGGLAAAIAFAVSLGASAIAGYPPLIHPQYAEEWMRADISCMLSSHPDAIADADRKRLAAIGGVGAWTNQAACQWLNHPPLSDSDLKHALDVIPGVWLRTAAAHPIHITAIHVERQAYLLPIPTARALNPPFIHSTVEYQVRGVEWWNPRVAGVARNYVRVWNACRSVFAFVGLWLIVLVVLETAAPHGSACGFGPTILFSLSLISLLFITAPIPDARYALFVLVAGQAALVNYAMVRWARGGQAR